MAGKARGRTKLTVVGGEGHPVGHNSGSSVQQLTDDDQQVLLHQHMRAIGSLKDKLATVNSDLRNAYKKAKAEGFTKKDLDYAFELQKDEDNKLVERRRRESQIAKFLGHPLGTQPDLFDASLKDDRPLKERAFDEGKRDGMKGDGPLHPPASYTPGSDGYEGYVEGWHAGQAALISITKKKDAPPAGLLRPEGNEPDGPDSFDKVAETDPQL